MLKRILYLSLFTFALVLLLSLMVAGGEEALPVPPASPVQAVLMPLSCQVPIEPETRSPAFYAVQSEPSRLTARHAPMLCDSNGIPILAQSYAEANYTAFHFSDEAG